MTTKAQQFENDVMAFARQRAKELDLDVDVRGRDQGDRSALVIAVVDADEAKTLFEANAWKFGYEADWFGKSFRDGSNVFMVVGVKPTAEKNALRLRRQDGKEFVGPVAHVRKRLA